MEARDKIDVWVVGSDISAKAVETAEKNINYAGVDEMAREGLIEFKMRGKIADPLVLQCHWPSPKSENVV